MVGSSLRCCLHSALFAAAVLIGCDGSEGTLVHTAASDGGGSGGSSGSVGGASPTPSGSVVPGMSWQAQLLGEVDPSLDVELFYLDPNNQSEATRAELLAAGKHLLCYVSAGTHEPWRDDADEFPDGALGNPLANYPEERWLDIRDATVRELQAARIENFAAAGCEGVLPANLGAYAADSGFDLTADDQLDYALFLASTIHARGMSAGLSISAELLAQATPAFDWALAIACLEPGGCAAYQSFRATGKPVLLIEFGDAGDVATVCPAAEELGFDALIKQPDLGEFRVPCPG